MDPNKSVRIVSGTVLAISVGMAMFSQALQVTIPLIACASVLFSLQHLLPFLISGDNFLKIVFFYAPMIVGIAAALHVGEKLFKTNRLCFVTYIAISALLCFAIVLAG